MLPTVPLGDKFDWLDPLFDPSLDFCAGLASAVALLAEVFQHVGLYGLAAGANTTSFEGIDGAAG